ncbi:MAG: bifunctional glutamate N-acetyltransferase/amino-acid acetyltransferase ArgJ [Desulfovibrio sp.]
MTIPAGYRFVGAECAFKKEGRPDLGLILSEEPAVVAGVFTTNKFQAAPVLACKERIAKSPSVRAFLVNSGQANACTGTEGDANCAKTCQMVADLCGIAAAEVYPSSTGVIGAQLKMDLWEKGALQLAEGLKEEGKSQADAERVADSILTTDTVRKMVAAEVQLSGGTVKFLGMAKGAGMISPNMATMLGFIVCDASVESTWWQASLSDCIYKSFNAITVDGDTSTNDTILAMANGASGVQAESEEDKALLARALRDICQDLAYRIVQDAEGGTKVMQVNISGAGSPEDAELIARAVGNSPLVKTALFGEDPNWGRIVAAVGRSGAEFDPAKLVLRFGNVVAFEKGCPAQGDLDALIGPLMQKEHVEINLELGDGNAEYTLWASDLTKEYISINADYRT